MGKLVVLDVDLDEDQIPPRGVEVLMPVPGKYVQMWEEKAFVGGGEGMVPPTMPSRVAGRGATPRPAAFGYEKGIQTALAEEKKMFWF